MTLAKYKSDVILGAHFAMGIATGLAPSLVTVWTIGIFLLGLRTAFFNPLRAYMYACYLVGMELLIRMASVPIPHEFTKYAVCLLLLVALFRRTKKVPYAFVVFMLLLLPASIFTDGGTLEETRQLISANLSGPLCIAISAIYFYNFPVTTEHLRRAFLNILFPLAAIVGFLFIKTPDFNEIEFGYQSNFVTSIYGPNQMSSILGLGVLLIGLAYFLRIRLFGSYMVSFAFLGMLLFRGLLTFSRGGMITPLIILGLVFVYFTWKTASRVTNIARNVFIAVLMVLFSVLAFNYANDITGNKLYDRYTGRKQGKQIEDIDRLTSGRTLVVYLDWQIFKDHLVFGAGTGMGKFLRSEYGYYSYIAAHNEFSRMLAEHGLFGLTALLILLIVPIYKISTTRNILERILLLALVGFCFVFLTHAATRIAAPCFLYGLAFVKIIPRLLLKYQHDYLSRQYALQTWQSSISNRNAGPEIG